MNDLSIHKYSVPADFSAVQSNRAAELRRAYMKGAYDAMRSQGEQDSSIKVMLAAMGFGFLCWTSMMFFVFRK